MANLSSFIGNDFNADDAIAEAGVGEVPPGKYEVIIIGSELKPTKANDGHYLELTHEILAPEGFKGRRLWSRLNLDNKNPVAVKIAKGQLGMIVKALGLPSAPDESSALHGQPMVVKVKTRKQKDGSTNTEISAWSSINDDQADASAAGSGGQRRAWDRG